MPNSYKDKMATWNSLSTLRNSIYPSSCIIRGDFSTHLNPGEKKEEAKSEIISYKISPISFQIGIYKTSNPQKEIILGIIDVLTLTI